MRTTVLPASRILTKVFSTTSLVAESRFPVGSSASTRAGSFTRARAIATRCICPPESSFDLWSKYSAGSPTDASASHARRSRSRGATSVYKSGSITFLMTVERGSRLNDWNTKPIRVARTRASSSSSSFATSTPSSRYVPDVGVSRQPSIFMSVDLPEPDGPMMHRNSPLRTASDTPRSACVGTPPES